MILPTSYVANWELLRQRRQHATDITTSRENHSRIAHQYNINDQVVIINKNISSKLARPTLGPFPITDVAHQNFNGTVTIRRSPNTLEKINIRRLRPYSAVEDANAVTGS